MRCDGARVSAYSDARNARARAEGWASYSQKYRAEKAGLGGKAPEYQARVELRRTGGDAGIVKRAASGRLLGLVGTQAGTVMAADLTNPRQTNELRRELARYRGDRHVRVAITRADGTVVNVGSKGGLRLDYVRQHLTPVAVDDDDEQGGEGDDDADDSYDDWGDYDYGGWDVIADDVDYGGGGGGAVSVTVTVA